MGPWSSPSFEVTTNSLSSKHTESLLCGYHLRFSEKETDKTFSSPGADMGVGERQ